MDELAQLKEDLRELNDEIAYYTRGVIWPEDEAELDWLIGRRAKLERAIYEIESGLTEHKEKNKMDKQITLFELANGDKDEFSRMVKKEIADVNYEPLLLAFLDMVKLQPKRRFDLDGGIREDGLIDRTQPHYDYERMMLDVLAEVVGRLIGTSAGEDHDWMKFEFAKRMHKYFELYNKGV